MWNMEITVSVPIARDLEHLANIAGNLAEELEAIAGDLGPVVSGRVSSENQVIRLTVDATSEDPTTAVSTTLELVSRVARQSGIPLGHVQSISLNIAEDAETTPELAPA